MKSKVLGVWCYFAHVAKTVVKRSHLLAIAMVTRSSEARYHVGSLTVERRMCNFVVVPAADKLQLRLITVFVIPAAADEAATRVFHSSFYRPLLFSYFCSPLHRLTHPPPAPTPGFISAFTTSPETHTGGAGRLHLASGERKESGSGSVRRSRSWSRFVF